MKTKEIKEIYTKKLISLGYTNPDCFPKYLKDGKIYLRDNEIIKDNFYAIVIDGDEIKGIYYWDKNRNPVIEVMDSKYNKNEKLHYIRLTEFTFIEEKKSLNLHEISLSDLSARDLAAIIWKKPISLKQEINTLIKENE